MTHIACIAADPVAVTDGVGTPPAIRCTFVLDGLLILTLDILIDELRGADVVIPESLANVLQFVNLFTRVAFVGLCASALTEYYERRDACIESAVTLSNLTAAVERNSTQMQSVLGAANIGGPRQ